MGFSAGVPPQNPTASHPRKSVMRRQFVAQIARCRAASLWNLLAQMQLLAGKVVNLLLLAVDDEVELIEQVFCVAELDLQVVQALLKVGRILHSAIRTQSGQQLHCSSRPINSSRAFIEPCIAYKMQEVYGSTYWRTCYWSLRKVF